MNAFAAEAQRVVRGPLTKMAQRQVCVLHYSGELSIKAKGTRNRFCERLARNLADAMESAAVPHRIRRTWARLYVEPATGRVVELASRVFGVQAVAIAVQRPFTDLSDILRHGEEIFAPAVEGKTFAVRVRRGGESQKLPFRSPEVERRLGSLLVPGAAGVDLESPQVEVTVELQRGDAWYSSHRTAATGGLPLGTEGRAVALVSGGFDSAVAAWLTLRRGVTLDYVFFNLGGDAHRDAVLRIMKVLADDWSFGYRPQLHMVDFRPVVDEIKRHCPQRLWQVLLKRRMLRAADQVARIRKVPAIVTGDAVGQVSSQTLQNLAVISAVTPLLILRPLATSPKEEIVALARRIGTHDLSAQVPEHCALAARHPETHANPRKVEQAESRLDPERLTALVEERAIFDLRALDLARMAAPDLEVDHVPEGAVVVDLRSPVAFRSWHYPGALHLGYVEALRACRSFEPGKTYLFYCEVGLKSAHLAELMHAEGYRAFHFEGGLRKVVRYAGRDDEALPAASSPVLL